MPFFFAAASSQKANYLPYEAGEIRAQFRTPEPAQEL
jgi:hypothetical protein